MSGGLISTAMGERQVDTSRPKLQNSDGSFSTERTITVEMDGKHYLLPTIVNGQPLNPETAVILFQRGQNQPVGVFATAEEAETAAVARSQRIGTLRGTK